MTTMFDIGDEITLVMRGRIREYTISPSGDCYKVEIYTRDNPNHVDLVYLDTNAMRIAEAKKVEN